MSENLNPLAGAWMLVSVETHLSNGDVIRAYGDQPQGVIVYTEDGYMTAQVSRPDRSKIKAGDQQRASDGEIRSNFEGYIAYHGTYSIDPDAQTVTHFVRGSMFKNWEGEAQTRFYEIDGDRVTLSTPEVRWGELGTVRTVLVWERLSTQNLD